MSSSNHLYLVSEASPDSLVDRIAEMCGFAVSDANDSLREKGDSWFGAAEVSKHDLAFIPRTYGIVPTVCITFGFAKSSTLEKTQFVALSVCESIIREWNCDCVYLAHDGGACVLQNKDGRLSLNLDYWNSWGNPAAKAIVTLPHVLEPLPQP